MHCQQATSTTGSGASSQEAASASSARTVWTSASSSADCGRASVRCSITPSSCRAALNEPKAEEKKPRFAGSATRTISNSRQSRSCSGGPRPSRGRRLRTSRA